MTLKKEKRKKVFFSLKDSFEEEIKKDVGPCTFKTVRSGSGIVFSHQELERGRTNHKCREYDT